MENQFQITTSIFCFMLNYSMKQSVFEKQSGTAFWPEEQRGRCIKGQQDSDSVLRFFKQCRRLFQLIKENWITYCALTIWTVRQTLTGQSKSCHFTMLKGMSFSNTLETFIMLIWINRWRGNIPDAFLFADRCDNRKPYQASSITFRGCFQEKH